MPIHRKMAPRAGEDPLLWIIFIFVSFAILIVLNCLGFKLDNPPAAKPAQQDPAVLPITPVDVVPIFNKT